jgi:hypothetical protein
VKALLLQNKRFDTLALQGAASAQTFWMLLKGIISALRALESVFCNALFQSVDLLLHENHALTEMSKQLHGWLDRLRIAVAQGVEL